MHPEVTGKQGDCSKCGMELTEPVAQEVVSGGSKRLKSSRNSIFYYYRHV
jgi:hypothetical protein